MVDRPLRLRLAPSFGGDRDRAAVPKPTAKGKGLQAVPAPIRASVLNLFLLRVKLMSTVLVVEDSQTDMGLMSRYLRDAGLSVLGATSGEEAQRHLDSQSPDLIILDVILPGQSGFELCRELKKREDTKKIPVVICSTKGTDVDKTWGTMLGANAYLQKPVDPDELLQTIRRLVG